MNKDSDPNLLIPKVARGVTVNRSHSVAVVGGAALTSRNQIDDVHNCKDYRLVICSSF